MVVSALTCCAWVQPVCDLKAAQMNMQRNLIEEFYEFELGHNTAEATKKVCSEKGKRDS